MPSTYIEVDDFTTSDNAAAQLMVAHYSEDTGAKFKRRVFYGGNPAGIIVSFPHDDMPKIALFVKRWYQYADPELVPNPDDIIIECEGHEHDPSNPNSVAGESMFCDGSCL